MTRPQDQHDPGGKVRTRLPTDIKGSAQFSDCGRYRHLLERRWIEAPARADTILWIGMNPSTADGESSDPTCTRELTFSRDWGYGQYLKANMFAYRATNPKDLPADPLVAVSPDNLRVILEAADRSSMIILAYGKMHGRYQGVIEATIEALREAGHPLHCLGRNKDGSARHPLYLPKTLRPEPF